MFNNQFIANCLQNASAKNFENRLKFSKDMENKKVGLFWDTVYNHKNWTSDGRYAANRKKRDAIIIHFSNRCSQLHQRKRNNLYATSWTL